MLDSETFDRLIAYVETIPDIDVGAVRDAMVIVNLHRRIHAMFERRLESFGLTANRMVVLEALYHTPQHTLTPAELADRASLTRAAMTGILDSLEKKKTVRRRPHPRDRRMVRVELTAAGRRLAEKLLAGDYRRVAMIMRALSSKEREQMIDFYQRLDAACREILAEDGA